MWVKKYDWNEIKIKYMADEEDEVRVVVGKLLWGWKKHYEKPTKGWRKEKEASKERVFNSVMKKKEKEEAKSLEVDVKELKKAKKASIKLLMKKISKIIDEDDEIVVKDIEKIVKIIKTELWEPTTISKNDTTYRWEPIDESKFIQD